MLEALLDGFVLIFQWPAVGYLALGILLGLYFGAVPGLSGLVGMAILLPFTFTMEPVEAFSFLLGMYAVTTTSDTISSVLLGRSEEHTSELQSLMRNSYAVFCLKNKKTK